MKFYIAGKITGLPLIEAQMKFKDAERELLRLGHEPVNPMDIVKEQEGKSWSEYMKEDIPILLGCDGIYLLRNWDDSKGAKLEMHIAEVLGMEILFEQNVCDICKVGEPVFKNRFLLGSDAVLCKECFEIWYEEGITDSDEIKKRRFAHAGNL